MKQSYAKILSQQVKVSNGVLNSSIVAEDNVVSVLSAPAPGVEQVTNTSMSVTLELKDAHSSISSVFIEVCYLRD